MFIIYSIRCNNVYAQRLSGVCKEDERLINAYCLSCGHDLHH